MKMACTLHQTILGELFRSPGVLNGMALGSEYREDGCVFFYLDLRERTWAIAISEKFKRTKVPEQSLPPFPVNKGVNSKERGDLTVVAQAILFLTH